MAQCHNNRTRSTERRDMPKPVSAIAQLPLRRRWEYRLYCNVYSDIYGLDWKVTDQSSEVSVCCALTDIARKLHPSSETNSKTIEPSTLLNNSNIIFNQEINPHNHCVNWKCIYNWKHRSVVRDMIVCLVNITAAVPKTLEEEERPNWEVALYLCTHEGLNRIQKLHIALSSVVTVHTSKSMQ
jgi:hypothetical protein